MAVGVQFGLWNSIMSCSLLILKEIYRLAFLLNKVDAHYFEEGNVQLDTNIDRKDSTIMQSPDDCAVSITSIIRHHESEYLSSLEESYLNLSDATFKDLRRKLPVTRTLFPWHNTLAVFCMSLKTRTIQKESSPPKSTTYAAARSTAQEAAAAAHPPPLAQKAAAALTTGALNADTPLRLPFPTQNPGLQGSGTMLIGAKGKRFAKKRYAEKAQMKKTLKMHDESNKRQKVDDDVQEGALPPYLLDRDQTQRAKVLSNTIKQKRKEKAGKWDVPLPKVRPVAEEEMFKVLRTGKRKTKQWKRMVTKATFVGAGFTRKPPKYERFIRPTGLRFTKAHVTHPELKCTFNLDIISVKKNPNGPMYTSLGVMTRGTIIEVNVSELGLVTPAGKVVWGKYAQVTNNPENDGCINAVLLV
ncbi:Ribosome biogenesis protein NSA2 [Zea mays]|uniref:Ribosome biogenesis protein NSA2 homolog n=1 Tax=Zea mays TaxID=4577 RepID=A0A3L6FYQ8_MAIZE|nr:Ribosome biogenesis protein NSA2 [Zea mays]